MTLHSFLQNGWFALRNDSTSRKTKKSKKAKKSISSAQLHQAILPVIEALETRQLLTAQFQAVETDTVSSDGTTTYSTATLTDGQQYYLVAQGGISISGSAISGDEILSNVVDGAEVQAASFTPSLNTVPATTSGSNTLPLSFRQLF